ncbi:hypothetical protein [Pontibacter flavimaris]|uniref:Uncharacterized protein n=1 Tax=Pontibacter flavimaris TaxID=1797110 RepID=A0A1Q5PFM5_9BACT|nr:hypothetical protein [Pontibacter flavimaris]OKL41039.1 hypothetical protein A3841_14525 [Pontibacter flavimaris]
MDKEKQEEHFSSPSWVTYLTPFTLIVPDDEEPLKVELDEINSNTYNHGKLCKIVSSLPIDSFDFELIICYDGALAIPKYSTFSEKEKAVDFFNNLFCKILLGGIYCEAVDRRDIVNGKLHKQSFIWPVDFGNSASTHLHSKLRMKVASNMDSIILSNPNYITVSEFHKTIDAGNNILSKINNLTPKFLVRGVTEITYRNWDLVLSNLWITVEQLIDFVWNKFYLIGTQYHPKHPISGRINSLKNDSRTWSTSVKQEIMYQNGILDEGIISKLYPARQARNKLVHEGKGVSQQIALDLYTAVQLLLKKASGLEHISFPDVEESSWESLSDKSDFSLEDFHAWKEVKMKNTPNKV